MKPRTVAQKQVSDVLYGLGFGNKTVLDVLQKYSESNRFYHNLDHVGEMLDYIVREGYNNRLSMNEWEALQLAIVFHDVIYNTKSKTNEEDSYSYYLSVANDRNVSSYSADVLQVIDEMVGYMIMATKDHKFDPSIPQETQAIIKADLERLTGPFEAFWNNTKQLMKEYAFVDWAIFKAGRLKFFLDYGPKVAFMGPEAMNNINLAYHTLKVWEPKIGIYPGSFNPFHVGHKRILQRAELIFDKVIIARGINPDKKDHARIPLPKEINNNYQVDEYDDLLTDYIGRKEYPVTVIRGLRSGMDLHGEITQYRYLQDLMPHIQLINIFTDVDVEHVSSSGIRSLRPYIKGKTQYELE